MTRNRKSAKAAGSRFERQIADCLAEHVDDRIDRRVKRGNKDCGDIGGVRLHGQRIVIECKDTSRTNLAGWMTEAENERGNDDALAGMVVAKRHGKSNPLDQWVHMTVRELIAVLRGDRIGDGEHMTDHFCWVCRTDLDPATAADRDRHGCGPHCHDQNGEQP